MANALVRELLKRAGSVWNMYGPTETTVWSSCYRITDGDESILIGRPIANTQIYILDHMMQPVPIGVAGELYIGGDGVTRGYFDRPELTEKVFVPDPFRLGARFYRTGDLARVRSDGNFEYITRIDTQVKVRGFRIELGEIESILSQHSSVDKCVAAVREDQPGDVRLIAYVVAQNAAEIDAANLRSHLRAKLPAHMVPQQFIELTKLPLTPARKVDRKNLPAPTGDTGVALSGYVAPRSEIEETLAAIWENLIGVSSIGINENFFDIGGNSLLALRLIHRINEIFQLSLSVRQLFDMPTIGDFALSVEEALLAEINSLTDEEAEQILRDVG
jgi:acyl carrier protein